MKRIKAIASILCLGALSVSANDAYNYLSAPAPKAYEYNDYYYQRSSHFAELPIDGDDIIFLGNSLSDNGRWNEMFNNPNVKNRGIISDVVQGVSDRVGITLQGRPSKIFLLIGVNDVSHHITPDSIAEAVEKLIVKIKTESPETELYLQSWLPINNDFKRYKNMIGKEETILKGNVYLEQVARRQGVKWINLFPAFAGEDCKLYKHMTNDGIHLNEAGYKVWRDEVAKYVCPGAKFPSEELYPLGQNDIIILGNNLVGGAEWHELLDNPNVKSRNGWADVVDNLYLQARNVAKFKPAKIVLQSSYNSTGMPKGLNVNPNFNADSIVNSVEKAILEIKKVSPETEILVQSIIPVNPDFEKYAGFAKTAKKVKAVNKKLQKLAKKHEAVWVDVYPAMVDKQGNLKKEYTNDGFRLMGNAYTAWGEILKPFLNK